MVPTTISPPPTKPPKVVTTFPGSPVVRISLVDETLSEIRNIVVNKSSVGKKDISSTSFAKRQLNNITRATAILMPSNMSRRKLGMGMIKNMIAAIR